MHYQGPEATDLSNVTVLNRAFLSVLSRYSGMPGNTSAAAGELAGRLVALTAEQGERLAQCPFLILSLAESDHTRWRRLFDCNEEPDLVDAMHSPPEALSRLAAATLGFLWELSRRNAYATRLVCGASPQWCESLAQCTPIRLVQFAASEPGILSPRFVLQKPVWQKLLGAGTNANQTIRHAAHIAALQSLLTKPDSEPYGQMATAACRSVRPVMRVADHRREPPEN